MVEHNKLSEDLQAITESLSDVMIARKISTKDMLTGIHAFLMALQASGRADARGIAEELARMSEYFDSLIVPESGEHSDHLDWTN